MSSEGISIYRKLPVLVSAVQLTRKNKEEVYRWIKDNKASAFFSVEGTKIDGLVIKTLEGDIKANFGDYVIQGVNGEFYPCKEDIFLKTYEEA